MADETPAGPRKDAAPALNEFVRNLAVPIFSQDLNVSQSLIVSMDGHNISHVALSTNTLALVARELKRLGYGVD